MRVLKWAASAFRAQRDYFTSDRAEIAGENIVTMQIAGAVGTVVCGLFFLAAPVIIPSWSVTREYLFILPVLLLTFAFSFFYARRKAALNPLVVELASGTFYVLLLAGFIALSVFPYPNTPQIFISLCFMFMPVLLILRPLTLLGIMFVSEAVFLTLAVRFKTDFAIENDIFNTMAAIVFSMIIILITNRLRCRGYFARAKLQKLSSTDALTSLMNKSAFEERGAAYLQNRETVGGCTLLVLDLDDFKKVNDTYGHQFGDALLSKAGAVLLHTFRQTDMVGRVGGDEFAVMMLDAGDAELARAKCELLCSRFAEISVENVALSPTCSIGAAVCAGRRCSYAELFRAADDGLYDVKRRSKGGVSIKII